MQLGRGIKRQPNLGSLSLYGLLTSDDGGLYVESQSLTSLELQPRKGLSLSGVTCPMLVDLNIDGHVYLLAPIVLKGCPWLEQPPELQSMDTNGHPIVYSAKWLNSKVVELNGSGGYRGSSRWDWYFVEYSYRP